MSLSRGRHQCPQQDPILLFLHTFSPKSNHVAGWCSPHPLQRQILDPPPILVSDIRNHDPPAITVYFNISGQMGWGNITFHKADCSTCCNNSLLLWMRWVKRLSRLCPEKKHLSLNWPSLENPQVYRYSYHHVVFYCWAQVY